MKGKGLFSSITICMVRAFGVLAALRKFGKKGSHPYAWTQSSVLDQRKMLGI